MNGLPGYKQKILVNLSLLLVLGLVSVFLIIGATPGFKNQWFAVALIVLVFVQIPLIISIGITGINAINLIVKSQQFKVKGSIDEVEEMEKEVEEKIKEADDLSFNLKTLTLDMGSYKDWESFGQNLLSAVSKQIEIVIGMVYRYHPDQQIFRVVSTYAFYSDVPPADFKMGEGLAGQVAKDKSAMFLSELPNGYIHVVSGLGKHEPNNLALIPLVKNDEVCGIVEIATFKPMSEGFVRRSVEISKHMGELTPNE